jgi:hypothetical protein
MSKLIALKSSLHEELISDAWFSDFSNLKQQALLFDQIGFFKLSRFHGILEETLGVFKNTFPVVLKKVETVASELRWLQQEGLIFELNLKEEFSNLLNMKQRLGQKFTDAQSLLTKVITIQNLDLKTVKDKTQQADLIAEQQISLLRLLAIIMETTRDVTTVTTFPYSKYAYELPDSKKGYIAQIVINKFPMPNNETPWEQIIDYRNDSENQNNLLGLRQWILKISREELSKTEIEDEIEWRINEFQSHMKLHKMKANTETLEVIVKAPLEIIENLIRLKFSKIPEPFFAFKKRQINLLEAELNAPGRELAYINKAREAFKSEE